MYGVLLPRTNGIVASENQLNRNIIIGCIE